jgi:hypothetical protein
MMITPTDIRAALALPSMNAPARRLPKDVLAQHGAANAADRKLIDSAIERLDWWATLSPSTVGVAAGTDDERPVPAIQLLAMTARVELTQRLLIMIHRAIPVPIILATALPGNGGTRVSLAPLRRAERIAGQMVVERLVIAPDLGAKEEPASVAFLASLALPGLPQTTLADLYGALVDRAEALAIARIVEAPFQLAHDAVSAKVRRAALVRYGQAEADWLAARAAARREAGLAGQVALGNQVQKLSDRLRAIAAELAGAPAAQP